MSHNQHQHQRVPSHRSEQREPQRNRRASYHGDPQQQRNTKNQRGYRTAPEPRSFNNNRNERTNHNNDNYYGNGSFRNDERATTTAGGRGMMEGNRNRDSYDRVHGSGGRGGGNRRNDRDRGPPQQRRYNNNENDEFGREKQQHPRDHPYNEDRRRRNDGRREDNYHRPPPDRYHDDQNRNRHRQDRSSEGGYYSDEYYCDDHENNRRFRRDTGGNRQSSKDDHRRKSSRDYDANEHSASDDEERKKKTKKRVQEWPPSFVDHGDAYTFDVRSAMFYEPLSDFFYDPKSKLYYGNKKHAYFKHDPEVKANRGFVEVQKLTAQQIQEQQQQEQEQQVVVSTNPGVAAAVAAAPKIAIKFKTKKVKSVKGALDAKSQQQQSSISKAKQQQIVNIGKWNEKQAELKDTTDNDGATSCEAVNATRRKVKTTVKGEPICVLCKRKFPNLAKLRLHEQGSELHKTNLIQWRERKKKKEEEAAAAGIKRNKPTNEDEPVYNDRAQKRRQLHGDDLRNSLTGMQSLQRFEANSVAATNSNSNEHQATDAVSLLEDSTNVGNQMLQKMGFSTNNTTAAASGQSSNGEPKKTTNDHLRKEWDRIEAMAQKSGSQRNR